MRLPPFTAVDWLTWSVEMAAQAAVLVTARRLRHRPHVPLFVFVLGAEVFMRATEALYLERVAVPGVPPAGAARALYHVVQALVTAWPAGVAALVWWAFMGPQKTNGPGALCGVPEPSADPLFPAYGMDAGWGHGEPVRTGLQRTIERLRALPLPVKAIFFLWLAFNAAMVAGFPLPRGWTQPVLHAWQGAMVMLAAAAIVRGWPRRREPAAQVAFALTAIELAVATVGPYAGNVFASWRTVGAGMYAIGFSLIAVWQWRGRPRT